MRETKGLLCVALLLAAGCGGSEAGLQGDDASAALTTYTECRSCHGFPPALPHPVQYNCGACHAGYVGTTVNAALHENGVVDVNGPTCTDCHGSAARAVGPKEAPPTDTKGNVSTTNRGVGAHLVHLNSPLRLGGVACTECHVVPMAGDFTHSNGVATVTFGTLASANRALPQWKTDTLTCSAVYCHGVTMASNAAFAPIWTKSDTVVVTCESCHKASTVPPHVAGGADCGGCHEGYTATTVNAVLHLDGIVQVAAPPEPVCTDCHGVPPGGTHPANSECALCHAGYTSTLINASLHQNGVVDVIAPPPPPPPSACTDCHGVPPAAPHPAQTACGACHVGYTSTTVNASLHENGVVDVTGTTCWSCHGNPPAPPHPAEAQCGSCHDGYVGTTVNVTLHQNGVVDVITPPPASFTLNVVMAGTGSGKVSGGPIACLTGATAGCSAEVANTTPPTSVALVAKAAKGSVFGGFTGCDSVSRTTCVVTLSGARTVTATFKAK